MNAALKKRIKNIEGEYRILFYMGEWRKHIPEQQVKIIIAEALSYCVAHEEIIIKGYLITNKKVALIFICAEEHVHPFLFTYNKQVKIGIHKYLQKEKRHAHHMDSHDKELKMEELLHNIFHETPLKNDWVVKLITGQVVNLPYDNPYLNQLKRQIKQTNFCSAIDYSGAKGPVKMNRNIDD